MCLTGDIDYSIGIWRQNEWENVIYPNTEMEVKEIARSIRALDSFIHCKQQRNKKKTQVNCLHNRNCIEFFNTFAPKTNRHDKLPFIHIWLKLIAMRFVHNESML